MEDVKPEVAVATVAHELAHVLLHHNVHALQEEEYQRQEDEAWRKVRDWGFGEEAEAHQRYRRWA